MKSLKLWHLLWFSRFSEKQPNKLIWTVYMPNNQESVIKRKWDGHSPCVFRCMKSALTHIICHSYRSVCAACICGTDAVNGERRRRLVWGLYKSLALYCWRDDRFKSLLDDAFSPSRSAGALLVVELSCLRPWRDSASIRLPVALLLDLWQFDVNKLCWAY